MPSLYRKGGGKQMSERGNSSAGQGTDRLFRGEARRGGEGHRHQLIDREKVTEMALQRTENGGIVFLDELDKLASPAQQHGPDISRQGVQRDADAIMDQLWRLYGQMER